VVRIFLGNGDGTFRTGGTYSVPGLPSDLAAGDLTGNGRLDLAVVSSPSNQVAILIGNGDGTFQPAAAYTVGVTPIAVAIADFNRDGKLDFGRN
jgi:hypothetical protein